jgi:hypothetical protein
MNERPTAFDAFSHLVFWSFQVGTSLLADALPSTVQYWWALKFMRDIIRQCEMPVLISIVASEIPHYLGGHV